MPFTLTLKDRFITRRGTIRRNYALTAFTGSYVSSGGVVGTLGDTVDFTATQNPTKKERPRPPGVINGSTANLPTNQQIEVTRTPAGFTAYVEQNATAPTLANFIFRLFAGTTESSSTTYAAISAAFVADPVGVLFTVETPFKNG